MAPTYPVSCQNLPLNALWLRGGYCAHNTGRAGAGNLKAIKRENFLHRGAASRFEGRRELLAAWNLRGAWFPEHLYSHSKSLPV
eukprot:1159812-Pelagomonas_calceolata.AAC.1